MRARDLDRHVQRLCRENKITRTVVPGRGRARVKKREIQHPPITLFDQMTYFVALHEVGHIVVGLSGTRLEREAACWRYALDVALIEPHFSIRQRICACLVRYLHRAQVNGWPLPSPEDDYWYLVAWWTLKEGNGRQHPHHRRKFSHREHRNR